MHEKYYCRQTYQTWSTKHFVVIVKGASDCLYDTSAMNFITEEQIAIFLIVLFIF